MEKAHSTQSHGTERESAIKPGPDAWGSYGEEHQNAGTTKRPSGDGGGSGLEVGSGRGHSIVWELQI